MITSLLECFRILYNTVVQLLLTYVSFYKNVTICGPLLTKWCVKQQIYKMKTEEAGASLKLLHNSNLLQTSISGLPVIEASLTFAIPVLVAASRRLSSSVSSAIRFLFSNLTCFIVENILSHTYVFTHIEWIFSVKSFSLENLSLLTYFWTFSTVSSNAVDIVHFH